MVSRRLRGVCGRVGCHRRRSASARSRTGRLCGSCGSARRVRRAARLGRRFAHHGMERTLWTAGCSGALPGFVSRRTRCLPAGGLRSVHSIHWLLLAVVAVFSAVSSALFMVSASRGEAPAKTSSPVTHLQGAFVRIIASYGLFGLVFALMITQFLIARHGHALSWTWLLSLSGVVISLVVEVVAKALLKQGFSWLLLLRFAAIPILVAFYPFDAGSEFSLRFAMGASAVALWVYLSLVVGIAAEAAGQIRVPFAIVWGVALGALALGAALGSSLALMMESLDLQGHVSVTAIAAMVLAVIASDVVLTRGSLARAYKRAVTAAGGKEAESADGGTPFDERVAAVAEVYALTEREAEVLGILARGHGLGRVQEVLFIAEEPPLLIVGTFIRSSMSIPRPSSSISSPASEMMG